MQNELIFLECQKERFVVDIKNVSKTKEIDIMFFLLPVLFAAVGSATVSTAATTVGTIVATTATKEIKKKAAKEVAIITVKEALKDENKK